MRKPVRVLLPLTLVVAALVIVGLALVGCGGKSAEQVVTKEVPVEVTRVVEKVVAAKEVTRVVEKVVSKEVPAQPSGDIPFAALWVGSAHADTKAEAFNHWNTATPPEVPTTCAKCHSSPGYRDFLGADGSAAGTVEKAAPIGTVIDCIACHNDAAVKLTTVTFPSGLKLAGLGDEARCMQCHQGRASTQTVDQGLDKIKPATVDTVSKDIAFSNIHYLAAAATLYGAQAMGGYQYPGKSYDVKFMHTAGFDTCVDCHNPHSLELNVAACSGCHKNVKTVEDVKNIRMAGSPEDYNGNGDAKEGIYYEVAGVRDTLIKLIQSYATNVSGKAIVYDAATNPYWFIDANKNGKADADELKSENKYDAWTARLVKAAYNYQTSVKDPGAFAHNAKYIIQLLYDSIQDLNAGLKTPVDVSKLNRDDPGHFAGSTEPFRHWDSPDGVVPGTCSKCHSAEGLPAFLKEGVSVSEPAANGFRCTTCHDSLDKFTRYPIKSVTFPSGAVIDSGNPDTNLCINCHQGRESTTSVAKRIQGLDDDTPTTKLSFVNSHYFAAGATLFGTQAKGAYEYPNKTYVGRNAHVEPFSNCTQCHSAHALAVNISACTACHTNVKEEKDLRSIRMSKTDFNGNGDTKEGIAAEIASFQQAIFAGIQDYAANVSKSPIAYDAATYPYFFIDKNGNGKLDADEAKSDNGYKAWTPRLLRATYNYHYVIKDPGAFAHNPDYILQVLYDTLQDLGQKATVKMTGFVRP